MLTLNYNNLAARPSSGRGAKFKDWSERSKHRTGTLRRSNQVIWTAGSAAGHRIANVARIHTGKDGKVYGYTVDTKQYVRKLSHDVWQSMGVA